MTAAPAKSLSRVRRTWISVAAVAALALLAAVAWLRRSPDAPFQNPLDNSQFTRLTDFEGTEADAAISPDGKFVAFLADQAGQFDVWLSQVGTGSPVNLTPDAEDERAPLRSLGFSWDGSEIWLPGVEGRKARLLPLVGGTPRVFLDEKAVSPAWSPDGSQLVYHTWEQGDPLFIADRNGANARKIFADEPDRHNHFPVWSRDGQWIYFVHGTPASNEMDLWRIAISGGRPERLTEHNNNIRDLTPLGDNIILYVAPESNGAGPRLWAYDIKRKLTHRITQGLEQYTSVSASADGRRLAATVANPIVNLWSVPVLEGTAGESDVKPFPLPSVRALAPRFRGETLYYLSSLGTGDGLWRYQDGQSSEIWKGANGTLFEPPAISPDGERIAIVLRKHQKRVLQIISADGSESRVLAEEIDVQGSAAWSPDGEWIVTGGADANGQSLFKIPANGGVPVRLTNHLSRNPVWSPDGALIAYEGPNVFILAPLLAVRPDGTPVKLPAIRVQRDGERFRFLPNGQGLVYMQHVTPWQDFWLLDLATLKTRQLTRLTNRATMRTFDVTANGKTIVFDRLRENSDVVVIDLAGQTRL